MVERLHRRPADELENDVANNPGRAGSCVDLRGAYAQVLTGQFCQITIRVGEATSETKEIFG
jgi:hypothetical protein